MWIKCKDGTLLNLDYVEYISIEGNELWAFVEKNKGFIISQQEKDGYIFGDLISMEEKLIKKELLIDINDW